MGLAGALAVLGWVWWGPRALLPIGTFGLLAVVIQVIALALVGPALEGPFRRLLGRWALGIGLRLLGVVVFAALVGLERELFPPVPSAVGYLGVLLPLLVLEVRWLA